MNVALVKSEEAAAAGGGREERRGEDSACTQRAWRAANLEDCRSPEGKHIQGVMERRSLEQI